MKHPRTTWSGIMTIVGGVLIFAGAILSTGAIPPMEAWAALSTALTTGAGLIAAADSKGGQ